MRAVDEMYLASLINKGKAAYTRGTTDPTALPAENILKMATINGAQSVLWEDEIGSLEVGKKVKIYCLRSPVFHFLSLRFTSFLALVSWPHGECYSSHVDHIKVACLFCHDHMQQIITDLNVAKFAGFGSSCSG
jgi:hypothetical protein